MLGTVWYSAKYGVEIKCYSLGLGYALGCSAMVGHGYVRMAGQMLFWDHNWSHAIDKVQVF